MTLLVNFSRFPLYAVPLKVRYCWCKVDNNVLIKIDLGLTNFRAQLFMYDTQEKRVYNDAIFRF